MSAWETFYLWISFHHHCVLCDIQQIYSVSSSPSLYSDCGLLMMGGGCSPGDLMYC